jgi:hypothetical protein
VPKKVKENTGRLNERVTEKIGEMKARPRAWRNKSKIYEMEKRSRLISPSGENQNGKIRPGLDYACVTQLSNRD